MQNLIRSVLIAAVAGFLVLGQGGCSAEAKKVSHLKQADGNFDSGHYDKAEIEYLNVLQIDPANPQAISRLGSIYFDQGRMGQVIPYLIKGKQLQPDNLDLRFKLGRIFLATGYAKQAAEEAMFILSRNPQDQEAPLLLAETAGKPEEIETARQYLLKLPLPALEGAPVLVALGTLEFKQRRLKEAESAFKRALNQDPKSSAAFAALGSFYTAQNDLPQAEQAFKQAAALAPARSPRGLLYARFKVQTKEFEAARVTLEDVKLKTPDYLPVSIMLAEIAANGKKYAESSALIAKVLTVDPNHPEALLLSGRVKLAQGENEKAVVAFQKMLKIYPQSPQANLQLGLAYYASGEMDSATSSIKQALTLAPGFPEAIVMLAELDLKKGNARQAIAALQPLVKQRPEIIQARYLLADAYRSNNSLKEALAVYRELEESSPRNPQVIYGKGIVLLIQGNREAARQAFTQVLELAPNYLLALEQLIDLDLREKNYPAARQRVDSQIARNPALPVSYLLQAKILLLQGETSQAEVSLRKVIELQPESSTAYLLLARLYVNSNQQEKALASFQAVSAKNPKNVEALMMTATIQSQQKNFTAARENYEKLLAVNPKFIPALNNLAYLYSEQANQMDKAQELAQKALELLPNEPHASDTLGWILFKKRQYSWALVQLQASAAKLPESAEVQFHLGMTYYMLGEDAAARSALQRTLELDRDFSESKVVQEYLTILAIEPGSTGAGTKETLEKALIARPEDPVVLIRLAAIYAQEGSVEKAVAAYQNTLRINPKNVAAMLQLTKLYADKGETTKALELARNARKAATDDPEVAQALGVLAYQTGDYSWSLSLLQEAAGKKPDDPEVLYALAQSAYSVGRVTDAQAAMKRALQTNRVFLHTEDARLFLQLTEFAANPGQSSTADRVEQILASKPNHVPALMAKAALTGPADPKDIAEQIYGKVLSVYPDFIPAIKQLALLYAETGRSDQKALDLAQKARTALPEDPETVKAMGTILYLRADYTGAANLLRQGARKRNNDASLMFYLGMSQYRLKQMTESKQSLQSALDLNLRTDLATEARKILLDLK